MPLSPVQDAHIESFGAHESVLPLMGQKVNQKNRRRSAPVLRSVKELSERTKVFIFNVGPWMQPIMN